MAEGSALARVLDALRRAGKAYKKLNDGGYMAQCPAHNDHTPSLSVAAKNGKAVLWCHAGCDVADVLAVLGLSYPDLFDHPLPDGKPRSTRRAVGRTLREFPYVNAAGSLVGITTRQPQRPDGKRPFLPLKPNPDGSWDLGASEQMKATPYRLPELVAAIARGETIWLCYADDTEVLTPDGWQFLSKLDPAASVAQYEKSDASIQFVTPIARQRFAYNGDMIALTANWSGLLVTPDHRVLTKWKNSSPVVIPASRVGEQRWLPVSGVKAGDGESPSPDYARLIAAWQADGVNTRRGYRVGWNLKKPRKVERLRRLLRSCGISWAEQSFQATLAWTYLTVDRRETELDRWVPGKRFHFGMLDWSIESRRALLSELSYWDGDQTGKIGIRYFTADERCAEVVSALAVTSGYSNSVRRENRLARPDQATQYIVNLGPREWRVLGNAPSRQQYNGFVYCLTVPSGFLVTRRDGKVVISGNCEGERDANTLIDRCGVAATSNAGGAGKWSAAHAYWLRGADVVICQDRDIAKGPAQSKAGERHTEAVLATLAGIAASVRVVEPRPPHKDVTDLIDAGGTLNDLAAVDITRLVAPTPGVAESNGHHPPPGDETDTPAVANGPEPHRGQLRFAQRFAGEYSGQLIHAHGIGWHYYHSRWIPCLDGFETRVVTKLLGDALRELPELPEQQRDDLYKDVRRCESAAGIAGILEIAGKLRPIAVAAERLDSDPLLLNSPGGTVHLETSKARKCLPFDYITKMTQGEFDPNARSAMFDEFLATIQPDEEMRAFLARSLGSSLIGLVRDHILFIWHGTGANGKSTLRDAVSHALGDYAISVPSDLLLQSKYGQERMGPEKMRLKGARLAFCSEISKGARLDEAIMKDLTGNDKINAKLLYKNPIEFTPSHTLIMLTNHLPQVRGDDPATWRRIMAVPFDRVIPDERKDLRLPERLRREANAVLAWIWQGWLDYQECGLAPPSAVLSATKRYQYDSDILARFLNDETVVVRAAHAWVKSAQLYEAFTAWAHAQGERHDLSQKTFSSSLEVRGFQRFTSNGVKWRGVALVSQSETDEPL